EEQYYLVWPLLMLTVGVLARRNGWRLTSTLWVGLAVIAIPSFLWSLYLTAVSPERAFFVTTTRMWELAIGAAVAIGAASLTRIPRQVAVVVGWAGLAAITVSGLAFSTSMAWPGYAAALPTVGTAAVIATGVAAGRNGPVMLLGTGLFRWVGGLSYSLYLWHWPLIIVATEYLDGLRIREGLLIAAIAVVPAWLTHRLVENPFRYSYTVSRYPKFALSLGGNFTLVGVVAGLVLLLGVANTQTSEPATGSVTGAAVLSATAKDDKAGAPVDKVEGGFTPAAIDAPKDVPELYDKGCQVDQESSEIVSCEYGPKDADTTIAVAGDSKVAQWVPALEILAEKNDWRVVTYTKSACPFVDADTASNGEVYASCREWTQKVLDRLTGDEKPDFVLTSQSKDTAIDDPSSGDLKGSEDAMVAGLEETWSRLVDADVGVIALADTPQTGTDIYKCVSENPDKLTACTYEKQWGIDHSGAPTNRKAADQLDAKVIEPTDKPAKRTPAARVSWIDLTDAICPTAECAPVIGNVLVYRQGSHITATYIDTLAPRLEKMLRAAGVGAKGSD
ncbi:MAG: acyltransferase family protein, partial [Nocardioidaceae bacterium]